MSVSVPPPTDVSAENGIVSAVIRWKNPSNITNITHFIIKISGPVESFMTTSYEPWLTGVANSDISYTIPGLPVGAYSFTIQTNSSINYTEYRSVTVAGTFQSLPPTTLDQAINIKNRSAIRGYYSAQSLEAGSSPLPIIQEFRTKYNAFVDVSGESYIKDAYIAAARELGILSAVVDASQFTEILGNTLRESISYIQPGNTEIIFPEFTHFTDSLSRANPTIIDLGAIASSTKYVLVELPAYNPDEYTLDLTPTRIIRFINGVDSSRFNIYYRAVPYEGETTHYTIWSPDNPNNTTVRLGYIFTLNSKTYKIVSVGSYLMLRVYSPAQGTASQAVSEGPLSIANYIDTYPLITDADTTNLILEMRNAIKSADASAVDKTASKKAYFDAIKTVLGPSALNLSMVNTTENFTLLLASLHTHLPSVTKRKVTIIYPDFSGTTAVVNVSDHHAMLHSSQGEYLLVEIPEGYKVSLQNNNNLIVLGNGNTDGSVIQYNGSTSVSIPLGNLFDVGHKTYRLLGTGSLLLDITFDGADPSTQTLATSTVTTAISDVSHVSLVDFFERYNYKPHAASLDTNKGKGASIIYLRNAIKPHSSTQLSIRLSTSSGPGFVWQDFSVKYLYLQAIREIFGTTAPVQIELSAFESFIDTLRDSVSGLTPKPINFVITNLVTSENYQNFSVVDVTTQTSSSYLYIESALVNGISYVLLQDGTDSVLLRRTGSELDNVTLSLETGYGHMIGLNHSVTVGSKTFRYIGYDNDSTRFLDTAGSSMLFELLADVNLNPVIEAAASEAVSGGSTEITQFINSAPQNTDADKRALALYMRNAIKAAPGNNNTKAEFKKAYIDSMRTVLGASPLRIFYNQFNSFKESLDSSVEGLTAKSIDVVYPDFANTSSASVDVASQTESSYLHIEVPAGYSITLQNGADSVELTSTGTSYTSNSGDLNLNDTIAIGSKMVRFVGFGTLMAEVKDTGGNTGGNTGGGGDPICFLANAPVLTPSGYRRIDSLRVGDAVKTADGRTVRIQRIKTMDVSPSKKTNPYIIPKGMFGARQRLLISPRHCVLVEGVGMVEARKLNLSQFNMPCDFTYYNLELPNWATDNLMVAGVKVESLCPEHISSAYVSTTNMYNNMISQVVSYLKKEYPDMTPEEIKDTLKTMTITREGKANVRVNRQA